MKFTPLKTEGLKGQDLALVEGINSVLSGMGDAATMSDVTASINDRFKGLTGEDGKFMVVTKAEWDKMHDVNDPTSLAGIVKAQGNLISQLKENGQHVQAKTLDQIFGDFKEVFAEQHRDKTGTSTFEIKLVNGANNEKAATVTAISTGGSVANDITTGTALRLGDGPIFEIKRGTPFVLDFVNVGQTNQAYLIWWDEIAKQGDFAITAEGVVKPMVQYKFDRKSADYKKAAGYSVLTDEFMNDMPQLVSIIKRLGNIDMMNDINAQILADMIAAFPTFTFTGLNGQIYHADDYAAIGAAICQIQSLFFSPTVLVLNPADSWKMSLTKDDVGRYQMPPFAFNGQTFEFGSVITDPRVPIGHFIVGDGQTFNVDMKGGVIVRIGYNGTDFITNQQTVVVEQYFYDYISNNRLGAWVYGTFASIKGIINDTTNS